MISRLVIRAGLFSSASRSILRARSVRFSGSLANNCVRTDKQSSSTTELKTHPATQHALPVKNTDKDSQLVTTAATNSLHIQQLVDQFKMHQPYASEKETALYAELAARIIKSSRIKSDSHLHHPSSLTHKLIILRMLDMPYEALDQETIIQARNQIDFEAIKIDFANCIYRHFHNKRIEPVSDKALFLHSKLQNIEKSTSLNELQEIYYELQNSPYPEYVIWDELKFFLFGTLSFESYKTLKNQCLGAVDFLGNFSRFRFEIRNEFLHIRSMMTEIINYLNDQVKIHDLKTFPGIDDLANQIQSVENEAELVKLLYSAPALRVNQSINRDKFSWWQLLENSKLKSWSKIRNSIMDLSEMVTEEERIAEFVFLVLDHANKYGVEFNFSEELINQYVIAEKLCGQITLDYNDDRHSYHRFYASKFDTLVPTADQLRQEIIERMYLALNEGTYPSTLRHMRYTIHEYQKIPDRIELQNEYTRKYGR